MNLKNVEQALQKYKHKLKASTVHMDDNGMVMAPASWPWEGRLGRKPHVLTFSDMCG